MTRFNKAAILTMAFLGCTTGLHSELLQTQSQSAKSKEERSVSIEVLSEASGPEVGDYLAQLQKNVADNWEFYVPEVSWPPTNKSGTVDIDVVVLKTGRYEALRVTRSSGNSALDHGASDAITTIVSFPPPAFYAGERLSLRFTFVYGPRHREPPQERLSSLATPQSAGQNENAAREPAAVSTSDNITVLSDTLGVDFRSYLAAVKTKIQSQWEPLIPESARAPLFRSGTVIVEFAILKNGKIAGMRFLKSSGDRELDRAAWQSLTASSQLPNLPNEFKADYLLLRWPFRYNPGR